MGVGEVVGGFRPGLGQLFSAGHLKEFWATRSDLTQWPMASSKSLGLCPEIAETMQSSAVTTWVLGESMEGSPTLKMCRELST